MTAKPRQFVVLLYFIRNADYSVNQYKLFHKKEMLLGIPIHFLELIACGVTSEGTLLR